MSSKSSAKGITPRHKGSGRANTKVWVTREGRKVRVCRMKDDHLVNTIKYLRRVVHRLHLQSVLCLGSFELFGEQALVSVEEGLADFIESGKEYPDVYYDMLLELEQRGLSHLVKED